MKKLTIDALEVLKSALDPLADPTYIVDNDFNLLWVNRSFRQAFGYRPRKRLRCHEVTQMDICGTEACVLARCLKSGNANQYQETKVAGALEPDASCLAGGMSLYHAETDEVVAVVGTMRDNSAEVRMHKRYGVMLDAERNRKELLEKEVAQRTNELVKANATLNKTNSDLAKSRREVTDILENISQAILTIDSDLRVGREYSRYAERVFGRESLYGVEFSELMAPSGEPSAEHKELIEWLKLVFHSPTLDWDRAKAMIQQEYQLQRDDDRVSELKIEFEPIREDQRVRRLMVLVEDLTEKHALQRAIDAKQQEMDENLDHLSELAQLDPELYEAIFEEAVEIIERATESLSRLRESDDPSGLIDQMFRDMHTLKGNAMSFGMVRVAAKAHWVEDAFSELRESVGSLTEELVIETQEKVRELGALFERIQTMASRVLSQSPPRDTGAVRSLERGIKLEVDSERLDALAVWAEENILGHNKSQELVARVRSLTLVPLGRLYGRLPKMIEDLADSLGKHVKPIELVGADVALYARVFNMVANVLVHLLRNSIDHGIEDPDVRVQDGRSPHGRIALRCFYDADKLCLEVEDDGAGMDSEKLVSRARDKGLIGASESPAGQDALQLIFMPGFSTADTVTETSGRGVGMDAVKSLIEELHGTIRIETRLGKGTTFHMAIPTSVALGDPYQ